MKVFLLLIGLIIAIVLYPFAVIFALNTLFPALVINYGFLQYLAVVILNFPLLGSMKALFKVKVISALISYFTDKSKE